MFYGSKKVFSIGLPALTKRISPVYNKSVLFFRRSVVRKSYFPTVLVICLLLVFPHIALSGTELVPNNTPAKVFFSPNGGCAEGIIKELDTGAREILVQACSFSSTPIGNALVNAQKRGVKVEIIFDNDEQKKQNYRTAKVLSKSGIAVYLDGDHASAHNKVIIIDRETIITGSFNFIYAAETKNAENVLVIKSPVLAGLYAENWYAHRKHSSKY